MRVLIDTNILIYREDEHAIPEFLQRLLKIFSELKIEVLLHPRSIEELKKDPDENRRKVVLSKTSAYQTLEPAPDPNQDMDFLSVVGRPSKPNDYVDNALLYAVKRNAVHFLITEDKRLHNKATRAAMADRVLSIEKAFRLFKKRITNEQIAHPPALKEEALYDLNLEDPFFDSLRKDYPEFNTWFQTKSREGRRCWVHFENDGMIGALLIYKVEDEVIDSAPTLPKRVRLKLCTFKVKETGSKIGELFIKLAVEYAIKNKISEIYFTHFPKTNDSLTDLTSEYGFSNVSKISSGENVFLKELMPSREKLKDIPSYEISKRYWPCFFDGARKRKLIVPIQPKYHNLLFVEYGARQTGLDEHLGKFIIEGNTIEKAYLCHSKMRSISKGDILLFYRSQDRQELTSLGVVGELHSGLRDAERISRLVGKRTVYSLGEIQRMSKRPTTVILFTWHLNLPKALTLSWLKKERILTAAPQTITQISHEKYLRVKKEGAVDERLTVG